MKQKKSLLCLTGHQSSLLLHLILHQFLYLLLFCPIVLSYDYVLEKTFIDLTHPISESRAEFSFVKNNIGYGLSFESIDFCLSGQMGTYVTAPSAYINNSLTIDRINPKNLMNVPAVVIDMPGKVLVMNRDSHLTKDDLDNWEKVHGRIPNKAIVILRSGWSSFFHMEDKFNGHFENEKEQVFPGFSPSAASWLIQSRSISGLGTECIDIELGRRTHHRVKILLAEKSKFSISQLANLHQLPNKGISLIVSPLRLERGPGSTARVFAIFTPNQYNTYNKKKIENRQDKAIVFDDTSSKGSSCSLFRAILFFSWLLRQWFS